MIDGALVVRFLADWLVIIILAIGTYVLLKYVPIKNMYQTYLRLFMMGLTALLLAKVASLLYQPDFERPFMEAGLQPGAAYLNNPGFPSDHALLVFTLTFGVWAVTRLKNWATILLVLSCLVSIARVLALVHTPIDVVGAFVIALLAAGIWYGPRLRKL